MHLINTDGLALIGPGSEWFWTAISGIVLAVTFIAIYRQLRLSRDAEAAKMIDGFSTVWNGERMIRCRLALYRWLAAGQPAEDQPRGAAQVIGNFWEDLATLGRRGHLDIVLLWQAVGYDCVASWYHLEALTKAAREEFGEPRFFEHFEWLAGRMLELDRRSGAEPLSRDTVASLLQTRIASQEERLRVEVALRSPDPALASTQAATA